MEYSYNLWGAAHNKKIQNDTEYDQEVAAFPFLLPSSLNGPPSPSTCKTKFPQQPAVSIWPESNNMQRFRFSATSQPFTPIHTSPPSPAAPHAFQHLQQELIDAIYQVNSLSEDLRSCQQRLKAKTGENVMLRKYINTLHKTIGEPGHPSDDYFNGEFGMLWRSIHNFGKCFYKFSTETSVPVGLGDRMKAMLGSEKAVYAMVRDSRTKLMVVAGILSRVLATEVFCGGFFEKMLGGDSDGDSNMRALRAYCNGQKDVINKVDSSISRNTTVIAHGIHEFLLPLMSRPGDQKHIDESCRQLVAFIEHASRLWIKITSLGTDNWRFIFPLHDARFIDATMIPCDASNLGLSGEQSRNNHALEQRGATIVFCVLPTVERFVADEAGNGKWVVLVKAFVLLD